MQLPTQVILEPASQVKIFGIGGAGGRILEELPGQGVSLPLLALNTDQQALDGLSVPEKLILGRRSTRGLGTGGDPQLGRLAVEEEIEGLKARCAGAELVVLVAGLGGGVGSGGSPVVARLAKEAGALVVAFVTLPFECEGNRRRAQALAALDELKAEADAVIGLRNQKIVQLIDNQTTFLETFKISNDLVARGIAGVLRLIATRGLIPVDFADLCAVVRGRHTESCFAVADASGPNRARELIDKLLASPMLDQGRSLAEAEAVLVSLTGGPNLTMAEVNAVMEEINRRSDSAKLVMGAAIDETLGDRLLMTLVSSQTNADPSREKPSADRNGAGLGLHRPEPDTQFLSAQHSPRPASRFVAPAPDLTPERKEQLLTEQASGGKPRGRAMTKLQQGQLPLEITSKGRFEKSEPTIYHGEDLDVPTYIRRGVALN